MLGVLCARPPKPWILNSLSLIAHGGSAAHHHENRLLHWPSHFADLSADNRRCRHHSTACRLGGGSEGGAASIWHAILPCGGDRGVKNRGDVWKNVERKGEGSWNVSWDARPARWLRPDSAWLLFGVCACLAPMPMDEFDDVNLDADNKTDASLKSDEKSSNHLSSVAAADNYKVTGILADGRCLFRAIAHGACLRSGEEAPDENRQRELADELRAQVVNELLKRRRFLFIKGKYVMMYKRDPHENPGIKPIRKGVIGPTLMVEELGRRKVNDEDLYVIQFYNRLDESKKGEIACPTAGEARKWMEAFDHAKQQAEYELSRRGSTRNKLNMEADIDLDGHRPRVRRYAHGLKNLIRIGKGPEMLLRQTSNLGGSATSNRYFEGEFGDAIEAHEWKCVRTVNGIRIFEDVADSKRGKGALVKAVGLVDASADTAFEVILNLERRKRYEWDMLTADLELIDSYDGHYDVVYGTYDPKYLTRWQSKRDFVFTRQWFRGQDGAYTILQLPAVHKKRPSRSGYRRTPINPSTWEVRSLNSPMGSNTTKCLVTHMLEIHSSGWLRWKKNSSSKFEQTIPYALLSQVAGLKEYIGANPSLSFESSATVVQSKLSDVSTSSSEFEDLEVQDEFYDAIAGDSTSSSEDEESEDDSEKKKIKLKNVSWAISSLALKRASAPDVKTELDPNVPPVHVDASQFSGSLHKGRDETDSNCWTSPSGTGFMIRGKTYLKDNAKIMGSDPLLKLIAVDWFKVDTATDKIALHPRSLVQSDAGKKLPFILVINLEVPAKPNYSLVLYYAAERPVNKNSLLGRFVDGTDMFRDARFKLIPSIVEGYWMVKRAVGTKACLLGKAVTCKYFRHDNFLEIDVDIGSSSVARSVIGLVLGYVTSLVVDLAILIEAKEEAELPEYILGTVRLNRVKPESAVPLNA